jgi:hypothetical protein
LVNGFEKDIESPSVLPGFALTVMALEVFWGTTRTLNDSPIGILVLSSSLKIVH